ncbi:MAG: alpha/beta fold hydrolase [Ignavibacteriae bacterium]|nr:alpha/beta fold hydrolase [Ignavibacteriota bacterium]
MTRFRAWFSCFISLAFLLTMIPASEAQTDSSASVPLEEEIVFSADGVTLAGTITLPGTGTPRCACVMLTGSGAQSRDNTIGGFATFRVLAHALALDGIATLRLDDRGVGGSQGKMSDATLETFASDALVARSLLAARFPGVPTGILGHSEGGAVALLAAARDPGVPFLILLAGPIAPVRENVLAQTELIHRANGLPETQIAREVSLLRRIFETLAAGLPFEVVRPDFRVKAAADIAEMPAAMRRALTDVDAHADLLFTQQKSMMDTPWFRSLAAFDPSRLLPLVSCPLLALFGDRDLQVPAVLNAPLLTHAAALCADSRTSVRTLPSANHLFQRARSGAPSEYRTLKSEFVDGLSGELVRWLDQFITPAD